jgi:hypothetical protein
MFQTWVNALSKPNEQTYAAMAASPNAKASTAYLWVFIGALVEIILSVLGQGTAMRAMMEQRGVGGNLPGGGLGFTLIGAICGGPIGAVITVIFFAIGVALVQWVAKLFGGRGTYEQLAYTFGAIAAPFAIITGVFNLLGAIPFVGLCFRILIGLAGLYVLVLNIMAAKGVNGFTWGAAAGSVLIPGVVVFLVCCCLVAGIIALSGAALGNIFSTINQSLTP